MTLIPERVDTFFSTARERHSIYLRRKAGQLLPYTEDPILEYWRFCNVFRELDKTTVWFRENVREPMRHTPEVLLSTVVFRFFNRIEVGEAIFKQRVLGHNGETAWELFLKTGDIDYLKWSIINYIGLKGPYVTGSYIVKTPEGFSKLDGVLEILRKFYNAKIPVTADGGFYEEMTWKDYGEHLLRNNDGIYSLEDVWNWLEEHYYIGHFTAYEIVSDLRHTDLLSRAPDIMTWANAGPGATRGLNYLHGRESGTHPPKSQLVEEMQELLELSQRTKYWPQVGDYGDIPLSSLERWPVWEMREVEHWLCELFKYVRARDTGQGPRQRFRP